MMKENNNLGADVSIDEVEQWSSLFKMGAVSIGELQIKIRGRILNGYEEFKNEFYPPNIGEILRYLPVERESDFNDVLGPKNLEGNTYSWKSVFIVARRLKKKRWRFWYWCRYHLIQTNLPSILLGLAVGAVFSKILL